MEARRRPGDTMIDEKVNDELTEFEERLLKKSFEKLYPGMNDKMLDARDDILVAIQRILDNETAKLCNMLPKSLKNDSVHKEVCRAWVAWTLATITRGYWKETMCDAVAVMENIEGEGDGKGR